MVKKMFGDYKEHHVDSMLFFKSGIQFDLYARAATRDNNARRVDDASRYP